MNFSCNQRNAYFKNETTFQTSENNSEKLNGIDNFLEKNNLPKLKKKVDE